MVVSLDPGHLGLLEHEFGHDHVVGIPGTPPREVARVPPKPSEQAAAELGRAGEGLCRR